MIFRSLVSLALVLPASLAFVVPRAPVSRDVVMSASRNDNGSNKLSVALQKLAVLPVVVAGMTGLGGAIAPQPALADGAVSAATVTRAGALYGPRIIALKSAVEKGDFAAIKSEEAAFRLFNSGAFALNRPLQKEVIRAYGEVAKAVEAKDAATLKSAWATYFSKAGLDKTNPFTAKDAGQAYSTDFTYTHSNKNFDPRLQ